MQGYGKAAALAAVGALALGAGAGTAQAKTQYAGDYTANTSQHHQIDLSVTGSKRRVNFEVLLSYRCKTGRHFAESVMTDSTDRFYTGKDGRIVVDEPWLSDGEHGPKGSVSSARHFTLDGVVTTGGWFGGHVQNTIVFFDEDGNKLDRCETGSVRFRGKRT